MLNYNKLRYFYSVAKHLNMTKAAEDLYISQPSLSIHIKELENELETPLFIRTNRSLKFTDAGKLLYEHVAPFFDSEDELIYKIQKASIQADSKVKVGILATKLIYLLPGIVDSFKEKYDGTKIKILRMNSEPLLDALKTGSIDIGFHFSRYLKEDWQNSFNSHCLEKGRFLAVIPRSNPLSRKERIHISELKDCKFALIDRNHSNAPHDELLLYCHEAGFEPDIIAEYSYIEPLLTMVNMGEAITLTSSLAPLKGYDNIRCVDLEGLPPIELHMLWKKSNTNAAVNLFAQHVIANVPIK